MEAVEFRQGWSVADLEKVQEKKKTKEGKKVAPAKARFHVPYTKNFFFWFRSIWVLRDPSCLNISSYET